MRWVDFFFCVTAKCFSDTMLYYINQRLTNSTLGHLKNDFNRFILLINWHVGKFKYATMIKIGTYWQSYECMKNRVLHEPNYRKWYFLTSQNDVILFYFLCQDLLIFSNIARRLISKYIYEHSLLFEFCFQDPIWMIYSKNMSHYPDVNIILVFIGLGKTYL